MGEQEIRWGSDLWLGTSHRWKTNNPVEDLNELFVWKAHCWICRPNCLACSTLETSPNSSTVHTNPSHRRSFLHRRTLEMARNKCLCPGTYANSNPKILYSVLRSLLDTQRSYIIPIHLLLEEGAFHQIFLELADKLVLNSAGPNRHSSFLFLAPMSRRG